MKTDYKLFATSLLLGFGIAAGPANASHALASWVEGVERQIDGSLSHPGSMIGHEPAGRVRVSFTRGADGRAMRARIERSSGSALLDGEAIRTVRNLRDLAPLPLGFHPSTEVRVDLAFDAGRDPAVRHARRASKARAAATRAPVAYADAR